MTLPHLALEPSPLLLVYFLTQPCVCDPLFIGLLGMAGTIVISVWIDKEDNDIDSREFQDDIDGSVSYGLFIAGKLHVQRVCTDGPVRDLALITASCCRRLSCSSGP